MSKLMGNRNAIIGTLVALVIVFGLLLTVSIFLVINPAQQNTDFLGQNNNQADLRQPNFEDFVSEEGRFSILMPGKSTLKITNVNTPVGEIPLYSFTVGDDNFAYIVSYADYPEDVIESSNPKDILDGVREGVVEGVRGTLISEIIISINGNPGREINIDVGGTTSVKSKVYLVENRLYQIMVVATNKEEIFLNSVNQFFDSFSLIN